MTAARVVDFVGNVQRILALVREAAALGAEFRISGNTVEITNLERLPGPLREALVRWNQAGWLYTQLGGTRAEQAAIDFCKSLRVTPLLVESEAYFELALSAIEDDKREHGALIGLDLETDPRPEHRKPGPAIQLTQIGIVHERQPKNEDRTGLDPHRSDIACLQVYCGGEFAFVFRGPALFLLLKSGWLRRQHAVVHNAPFELAFLSMAAKNGLRPDHNEPARSRIECSMQAGGLVYGVNAYGGGRALDTISEKALDKKPPKNLQTSNWGAAELSAGQLAYAASDAILARKLWPILSNRMTEASLWGAYELQRRVGPPVVDMKLRGLGFDQGEHRRQVGTWSADLNQAQAEYVKLTGRHPPENSEELRDWLKSVLTPRQLETWTLTPTQNLLSVAGRDLKRLVGIDSATPVLQILAKTKLLQNFGSKLRDFVNPVTGRIHADYWIGGSKAGRFSCRDPNMQQLPNRRYPEFRRCVIAGPGTLLVVADYDQIELRAAAYLSQAAALTSLFAEGRDAHREMAAKVAGVPYDEVTREQRQGAKAINFGLVYGAGAARLQASIFDDYGIEVTLQWAQGVVNTARQTHHQLYNWQKQHERECQRRGYIRIGAGRIARAEWEKSGQLFFTQCCNLPVQGIAADCMLRAITRTYALLRRAGIRGGLVASVHDELLLEVVEDDAENAREILEQGMTEAFVETFPGAPTVNLVTAKIGHNWQEAKP